MTQDILSRLGELILWLTRWYTDTVVRSWRRETRRIRHRNDKLIWIGLCIFFTLFLFPYLTKEAFSISVLLGLSFLWSSFMAISFAYILRNPLLLILVYVGVIFSREIMGLLTGAKEEATGGNILGAVIVFALGVYLLIWANHIKKGEIEIN